MNPFTASSAFFCTEVSGLCVGGELDGEYCDDCDLTACETGGGTCQEAGSVKVTVTAFRCEGEMERIDKVCETSGTACVSSENCPAGQNCIALSVPWSGTVEVSDVTFGSGLTCPGCQ